MIGATPTSGKAEKKLPSGSSPRPRKAKRCATIATKSPAPQPITLGIRKFQQVSIGSFEPGSNPLAADSFNSLATQFSRTKALESLSKSGSAHFPRVLKLLGAAPLSEKIQPSLIVGMPDLLWFVKVKINKYIFNELN